MVVMRSDSQPVTVTGIGLKNLGFRVAQEPGSLKYSYLWLAGNEGMEKKMETAIKWYIGTTTGIHSFLPSQPTVRN